MTVVPQEPTGAVSTYDPEADANLGLEDVSTSDLTIPRIQIKHKEAVFRNSLTNEDFTTLDVVILGLVKQRIMWHSKMDEKDKPLCKSTDFDHGFPQTDPSIKKQFPWAESNFNRDDFQPNPEFNNLVVLPCEACVFQKWGTDKTPPPCSEMHTYAVMVVDEYGNFQPSIFSVQRTGIKPSRTYLNGFVQAKTPMFTVKTQITLEQRSRGDNDFCVPVFKKGEPSNRDLWGEFATTYRSIRDFLRMPPRNLTDDEEVGEPSDNTNAPPTSEATQSAPSGAATPATSTPKVAPTSTAPASAAGVPAQPATPTPEPASESEADLPF